MYKSIKIRIVVIILLSVILGYLGYTYFINLNKEIEIVVINQEIEARTIIKEEHLKRIKVRESDKNALYKNVIQKEKEAVGLVTRRKLHAMTPVQINDTDFVINEESLALTKEGTADNTFFIPEDKRLVAFSVDSTGAINNTVKKGDYIDIIYTSKEASTGGIYSRMILQHMEVFDIENTNANENGIALQKQNIIVVASPEECLDITLAGRNGTLDCVLNPLEGQYNNAGAKSIYAYKEEPPYSIRDQIEYIREYVNNSYIPYSSKEDIVLSLDKALDKDFVELIIREASLDMELKEALLHYFD